jgi:hypothetical protein
MNNNIIEKLILFAIGCALCGVMIGSLSIAVAMFHRLGAF